MILIRPVTNRAEMFVAWSIREQVFVQEQNVPLELEKDELDESATHVLAFLDGEAVGTGRIYQDDLNLSVAKLGRVAVLPHARGNGVASAIIEGLLEYACENSFEKIEIHSQLEVIKLYEKFGFRKTGSIFEEAGIPHQEMRLDLTEPSNNTDQKESEAFV